MSLLIISRDLINRPFRCSCRENLGKEEWDEVACFVGICAMLEFGRVFCRNRKRRQRLPASRLLPMHRQNSMVAQFILSRLSLSWTRRCTAAWRMLEIGWRKLWIELSFLQHCSDEIADRDLATNLKNLCSSSASGHVQPTAKVCGRSHFWTGWRSC
jgi:hypothetical protein